MDHHDWLAERFEAHRAHLRAAAYRMLGSLSEADDAVQEAWLRLSRADTGRARRRVRGAAPVPDADLTRQRAVVDAFLAAARGGDFDALVAVLDPDVVLRGDRGAVPAGASREVRGARAVAEQALTFAPFGQ